MSEAQREQLDALLDGIHAELLRAFADGRRVDAGRAAEMVDGAPYVGNEAVEPGLVDRVAYEDEVPGQLMDDGPLPTVRRADAYLRGLAALRPAALRPWGAIALIRVHGTIVGPSSLPLRVVADEDRILAAIRVARANKAIRGVVLHINSPGGSALASDRIHHELSLLSKKKPLVACLADVAASGGYYIAAAAHEIVAQPVTITGSIFDSTAFARLARSLRGACSSRLRRLV